MISSSPAAQRRGDPCKHKAMDCFAALAMNGSELRQRLRQAAKGLVALETPGTQGHHQRVAAATGLQGLDGRRFMNHACVV